MLAALDGLRVVDLSTWIAGGYCTKLLADVGASVTKVEPPDGDPLRRWSASGAAIAPGANGALFNYLDVSKQHADAGALDELLAAADAVVWSTGGVRSPRAVLDEHPHLTVTAITPFGLEGPWADKPATEFTLQAWSGGIVGLARGLPDRAPVHVGGQIGEWVAGVFAAIGTLASRRRADPAGELVDVSVLESAVMCLTYYPVTFNDQLGRPMRKKRFVPTPGVGAARDGLVGLGVGTGQQWLDFCAMVGHPEWMDEPKFFLDRSSIAADIEEWIAARDVDEVLALASAFRIPNAPVANGENVASFAHFRERETFVANARDGVTNPAPPFRITASPVASRTAAQRGPLPFSGVRVLDMTAYWAGPLVGHTLALLGADVIHLESAKRPDGARLVGGVPQTEDRYWERGPIFAALNTNKRSLAIDVGTPRGRDIVRQFVGTCDVVVENYTPRVLDQLGLGYESLRAVRPDLVMARMPGFGLDGPWRDQSAFAFVIEDASGLTWLTGHPDLLPFEPYCVGDPNAGLHAIFGLLLALEHRDRTGEGALVEAAMVDAALNVTAEQVIEQSAYRALLQRAGNRGPVAAPQNLYRAAAPDDDGRDDSWVAVAVVTDRQWGALCDVIGQRSWVEDPRFATATARRTAHDQIDEVLAAWCRVRSADDIVAALWDADVPVAKVILPHRQPELPQLASRGFFETIDHPVIGSSRYSTLPMRFSRGPEQLHAQPAPLLGEHNRELLGEIGLTESDIDALEAEGIIGRALEPHA